MMLGMSKALVVAVVMLVGCTPKMHKVYQVTMATVASAAFVCDGLQTNAAIQSGRAQESNPVITVMTGPNPSPGVVLAITGTQALAAHAIPLIPSDPHKAFALDDWLKDMIITVPVMLELSAIATNQAIVGGHIYRCGR